MLIKVINGPNLNMLGIREPEIYGSTGYESLCEKIRGYAKECGISVEIEQSNHEGDLVDRIQEAYGVFDGIVINPAAYTHTSVAILDALKAIAIPAVEVHLSNIYEREEFRHGSYPALVCVKSIYGKHFEGYREAMEFLKEYIQGLRP